MQESDDTELMKMVSIRAAERVFSLLQNYFFWSSLEDSISLSIMLQYNPCII